MLNIPTVLIGAMRFSAVDWLIIIGLLIVLIGFAAKTKALSQSVADFLAANRSAGRYLVTMSSAWQDIGAISVIAWFEVYYISGFASAWWQLLVWPSILAILALAGYIQYRFRQTRAMTMAQFFEMRYSKQFRIFAGLLAFVSGIVNFGIFPAVGGRFFIQFCGLPENILLAGISISTFALCMIVLLLIALFFVFIGGQITVLVTDFLQGMFNNVAFIIIIIVLLFLFKWDQISDILLNVTQNASLVNPFKASEVESFGFWYWMMNIFLLVYWYMIWQGNQGNNCSAKNPHEARMGRVLSSFRIVGFSMLLVFIPICAYTFMHHPDFSSSAQSINAAVAQIENPAIQSQMRVPIALTYFLPVGVMGLFAAVMLSAFISTHDTYLHSWGSIFIQDVILPLRKKPLTPKQHLRLLRLSILGVAVFIFFFSLLFEINEYIFMFQTITGAIFAGGAGVCIVGGLYWKRGTTAAAWTALSLGAVVGIGTLVIRSVWPALPWDSMYIGFFTCIACIILYIVVSLLDKKTFFDMDKMLHRGKYAIREDSTVKATRQSSRISRLIGMGNEFTRRDKIVYLASIGWIALWLTVFIGGTVYNMLYDVKSESWLTFWKYYTYLSLGVGIFVTVWFVFGGIKDIKDLFATLRTIKRDEHDDGRVVDHHNLADEDLPPEYDDEQVRQTEATQHDK